jgi:hypothetical protein
MKQGNKGEIELLEIALKKADHMNSDCNTGI